VQTVFVTGAEGFAGGHVFELLRRSGYDAVGGVRNRARKLAYERQGCKALVCDVSDAINVARAIASVRPDAVIHLAGLAHPVDAANDPLLGYQSIVTAWANVLDADRRTVPRARVVLASACDVYGDAGRDGHPLSETSPAKPINTFGSLKRTAESIAHTFFRDYHLNITIARPFHYTGAHQSERFFLGSIARQLVDWAPSGNGHEFRAFDLACRRDILHVQDLATAYLRLLEDGRPNETYNICSGQALTCREIVSALAAQFGHQVELAEEPVADNDGHIHALCGDGTKLRQELGWTPTHSVQDALHELVAGYRTTAVPVSR
jgi:GDP-4-dehydro-6-deoxy-D-mannose reductase